MLLFILCSSVALAACGSSSKSTTTHARTTAAPVASATGAATTSSTSSAASTPAATSTAASTPTSTSKTASTPASKTTSTATATTPTVSIPTPAHPPTTRRAFVADADAICKAGIQALGPLKTIGSATSAQQAEQILDGAANTFSVALGDLSALKPPHSLANAWARYLTAGGQEKTVIAAMASAIGAGNTGAFASDVKQAAVASGHGRRALAGKGFSHCGTGH
jgi:hypothetical protein